MPPRRQPSLLLPQSPLLLVLTSMEIGSILAMRAKIPQVQEALRKQGYPVFEERKVKHTQFVVSAEHSGMSTKEETVWGFLNAAKTHEITLTENRLTFLSAAYTTFEVFLSAFEAVLETAKTHIEPSLIHRIGLRYVDLIAPTEGNPLEKYVSPSLRGPESEEIGRRSAFVSQSFIATGVGHLMIRFGESDGGFAYPPDLLPLTLKLKHEPVRATPFGLLDLDHGAVGDLAFDIHTIVQKLWDLHDALANGFKHCTTPFARDEWAQTAPTP